MNPPLKLASALLVALLVLSCPTSLLDGGRLEADEMEGFLLEESDKLQASFIVSDTPIVGEPVQFDASESEPIEEIVQYEWDFTGDGHFSRATHDPVVTYTFADASVREVVLKVSDDRGNEARYSKGLEPRKVSAEEPEEQRSDEESSNHENGAENGLNQGEQEEQPRVSTVFYEEDIREALNEVALQTGVNIIFDETVVGTVTLDLDDVPLEQALEMILVSGGYTYHKVDDYYLVGLPSPQSPMFDKITVTETIRLDYISASQAVQLLPPFYEDFVRTSPDRDQVLTISAPEQVIEEFRQDLARIDTAPEEVIVEAIVTEVSAEVLKEYGGDLFGLTIQEGYQDQGSYSLEFDGSFALEIAGPAGRLLANLRALEDQGKAEIKANPRIRVGDGESASLFLGEERVLILEREEEDDLLEEVEVGMIMEVTPRIMAGDEIRLEVAPNISHFIEERRDQLIVRRSELSSVIRTRSEETVTMAGMTLDEVMEYESTVPILGDIPLIRWLFREETVKKGERELLVLITPEIIAE